MTNTAVTLKPMMPWSDTVFSARPVSSDVVGSTTCLSVSVTFVVQIDQYQLLVSNILE
jgi:hypothetical protein